LLAPGGRIVFYGGTAGAWPKINPALLFFKQGRIEGSTMGSPSDFKAMVKFVDKHKLVPVVSNVFDLAQCQDAFEFMEQGRQTGNIVFSVD
jgi:D-arabinose 1-dehydrogenase-like Zn-dependent alcohol dehydrogenase